MAKKIFEANKGLDVVYKTSDDNCFYTENNANNHAKGLKNKKVVKVTRAEALKPKTLPVDQRIKAIKELTTVEAVEKALKEEKHDKVLAAGKEKIEKLNQA